MAVREAGLRQVLLPEFGEPAVMPFIPKRLYAERLEACLARAQAAGFDLVIVYGDREHAANIAYMSGYDPRFEEALLIFGKTEAPQLLIGNEGWGYAELCDGPYERVLCQTFSLPAQPRGESTPFPDILSACGVEKGAKVAAIGWKPVTYEDNGFPDGAVDIPEFITAEIRKLIGSSGLVKNAAGLLMNPRDGMRALNDADQLAMFEFAATFTSQGVRNVLAAIEPGMSELAAARHLGMNGLPLCCHPMLSAGRRAAYGLPSPSLNIIERGDPVTVAYGAWGALNARAGFLVEEAKELPDSIQDYVEKLVAPYFTAVVDWYETLAIGAAGGRLWSAIHDRIGGKFFNVTLNPGHLIHIDEWMHSPVFKGSDIPLKSGMAMQVDVIPATGTPYFTTNIEDGIAIADEKLRDEIAHKYPEAWIRIQARRRFMTETLGIRLRPEVLPFSNIPAFLPPFWLARNMAMAVTAR
jgi:hypothetical protein